MHDVRLGRHRQVSTPIRLLISPGRPVKAAKTFAYKISASFRRQTKFVRQKYRQKFRQLEEKFLNSSQGEAGLIFAVPNIPAHVAPAELASALNDTLARLCNESQGTNSSDTSLSPDSAYTKDLLDFEHEEHPPTSRSPATASNTDLLLPELYDVPAPVTSHSTSPPSIDDLLCRHGLDELLQVPLLPISRQDRTMTTEEPHRPDPAPSDPFDFLKTLMFQDLGPYPVVMSANVAGKQTLLKTRIGFLDTNNDKVLLRKQAGNNLRQVSIEISAEDSPAAAPTSHPQCLRPGALNIHRAERPRLVLRPAAARTYEPSQNTSSPYTAYRPGRAPLLPPLSTKTNSLMEEMANELDKVLASLDNMTGEEKIADKVILEASRPDPLPTTFQPIVPLRISSRPGSETSGTTFRAPLSFKDRLLDASRSAILAAADEAETSELRWFHCGT
jgi:hypothetical protein